MFILKRKNNFLNSIVKKKQFFVKKILHKKSLFRIRIKRFTVFSNEVLEDITFLKLPFLYQKNRVLRQFNQKNKINLKDRFVLTTLNKEIVKEKLLVDKFIVINQNIIKRSREVKGIDRVENKFIIENNNIIKNINILNNSRYIKIPKIDKKQSTNQENIEKKIVSKKEEDLNISQKSITNNKNKDSIKYRNIIEKDIQKELQIVEKKILEKHNNIYIDFEKKMDILAVKIFNDLKDELDIEFRRL